MATVEIPFRPIFKTVMLTDIKTMTCRPRVMGRVDDRFRAFGAEFELTHVLRTTLLFVASDAWRQEGVESPAAFQVIWEDIHPRRGFDPEQVVYAHIFRRVMT